MIREFAAADQAKVIHLQEQFMVEFFPEFADDSRRFDWNADAYSVVYRSETEIKDGREYSDRYFEKILRLA